MTVLIKGGTVVTADQTFRADVLCADGKLRTLGTKCWKNHGADEEWYAAREEWREKLRRDRFILLRDRIAPAAGMPHRRATAHWWRPT